MFLTFVCRGKSFPSAAALPEQFGAVVHMRPSDLAYETMMLKMERDAANAPAGEEVELVIEKTDARPHKPKAEGTLKKAIVKHHTLKTRTERKEVKDKAKSVEIAVSCGK